MKLPSELGPRNTPFPIHCSFFTDLKMHTFPLYIQLHNIIMHNHNYEHVYVPGVNVFFLSIRSLGYGDVCRILINGSFGAISILVGTKEVCRMAFT